jgi:hypothetical protein
MTKASPAPSPTAAAMIHKAQAGKLKSVVYLAAVRDAKSQSQTHWSKNASVQGTRATNAASGTETSTKPRSNNNKSKLPLLQEPIVRM